MEMSSFKILRPLIDIREHKDSGITHIHTQPGDAADGLTLTNIRIHHSPHNQLTAAAAHWQSSHIFFNESGKDSSLLSAGSLTIVFKDLLLQQASVMKATRPAATCGGT